MLGTLKHPRYTRISVGALALAVALPLTVPGFASTDFPQPSNQASSSQAISDSTRYTSCKKLRKIFPRGVAKNQASQDAALAHGYGPSTINKSAYKANRSFDKNGNRVVCEVSAVKARKNFRSELLAAKLLVSQAGERIENAGYVWRVGSVDGEAMAVTEDYRMDRLTLSVNAGTVTDAVWG